MSRQKVEQAITLAAGGALKEAQRLLSALDDDFVRKRLRHHLTSVRKDREGAELLWRAQFPDDEPPALAERSSSQQPANLRTDPSRGPSVDLLAGLLLENPGTTLAVADRPPPFIVDLAKVQVAQVFALAAFAALGRTRNAVTVVLDGDGAAERFALAVGLRQVVEGSPPPKPGEPERTIPLRRITGFQEIEPAATEIASLILPHDDEARPTIRYVLVELLRNVIQHSGDPLGAVVAAQRTRTMTGPSCRSSSSMLAGGFWRL